MKPSLTRFFLALAVLATAFTAVTACNQPTNDLEAKKPLIKVQPQDTSVALNTYATLSIEAVSPDGGKLSYQWYKRQDATKSNEGGIAVGGAIKPEYKTKLTSNTPYAYYCIVTNTKNGTEATAVSDSALIRFLTSEQVSEPTIRVQPIDQTVVKGQAAVFTVVAEGNGTLSYQWYTVSGKTNSGGTPIKGATTSSYTVTAEQSTTLYFYCEVTNTGAENHKKKTTEAIKLTVLDKPAPNAEKPEIQAKSKDKTVKKDTAHTISVTAASKDGGTLSYQWYKALEHKNEGGEPIPSATEASYSVATTAEGTFYYYCVVTNTNNKAASVKTASRTSDVITVTVIDGTPPPPAPEAVDENGDTTSGMGWDTQEWELGSTKEGQVIKFAVYSKNAEKLQLELYSKPYGLEPVATFFMEKNKKDNIWRAKIDLRSAETGLSQVYYGFRAWGPNWKYDKDWKPGSDKGFVADVDEAGNRFNPNKLLFDPYARELSHDKSNKEALQGKNGTIYASGEEYRTIDTARYAPKAVVLEKTQAVSRYCKIAQKDAIIYEAHVRGLTKHESASSLATILGNFDGFPDVGTIPEHERGTYAGAAKMAPYLKGLGINTIEFLPVHESDNDGNHDDHADAFTQFWGYMTYGFFAPDRRYSSDKAPGGPTREFKEMVQAFHDNGIEVYLDVVYNHSGEGGLWDKAKPDIAGIDFLRGLDNSEYYALSGDKRYYFETTGCGNNLRCDNPPVHDFVMDSLKYWAEEMGVDGFRFDLAPVLGQEQQGDKWRFNQNAKLLLDISNYAANNSLEVIAEAWAAGGDDAYQVGNYPDGWGEWNGRYRDRVRRFINYGTTAVGGNQISYADALTGDYHHFNDQGGAAKSVNFITAHDGFTLADLVSYNGKNNEEPWPFGKSDGGSDQNESSDSGNDHAFRRQKIRNFLMFLMLSRGVPMIVYGDEFGRTQKGNNNPFNIDSVCTWNNYDMLNTDSPHLVPISGGKYHNNLATDANPDNKNALFLFAREMIQLRKNEPALRANYDLKIDFAKNDGGFGFKSEDDRACRMHIKGSTLPDGNDYVACINMWEGEVKFKLPAPPAETKWVRIADTAKWAEKNDEAKMYNNVSKESDGYVHENHDADYGVNPWSIVLFKAVKK